MGNYILTREELLSHNPCADGLDWFDSMVRLQGRKKSLLIRGATSLLWLYSNPESRAYASWAQNKGLLPPLFAPGANLQRANLSLANFQGADLRGADIYGADLSLANLAGADLSHAALAGTNLSDANLQGANLHRANLQGADLRGADLYGADLSGALRDASDPPIPGWKLVDGRLQRAVG